MADIEDFDAGDIVEIIGDYAGDLSQNQLSLNLGDRVLVIGVEKNGWLYGEVIGNQGQQGYFPFTYCQIEEKYISANNLPPPPDLSTLSVPSAPQAAVNSKAFVFIPFDGKDYSSFKFANYAKEHFREHRERKEGALILDTIQSEELIFYQEKFKTWLTKEVERVPEMAVIATQTIENMTKFVMHKEKDQRAAIVRVVDAGIKYKLLRDEIYVHICKQLNHNSNNELVKKYWELMHILLDFFVPVHFLEYMICFLRSFHVIDVESPDDLASKKAEMKMAVTYRKGGSRIEVSTTEEQVYILSNNNPPWVVPLFFCDGTFKKIRADPNTTIQEFKNTMSKSWKRVNKDGKLDQVFAVYEIGLFFGIQQEIELENSMMVRDVMARWTTTRRSPNAKFLYKIKLYTPELQERAIGDYELAKLLFMHGVYGIVHDEIKVNQRTLLKLASYQLQNEIQPNKDKLEESVKGMIKRLRENPNVFFPSSKIKKPLWVNKVSDEINKMILTEPILTREDSLIKFVKLIAQQPTYGTVIHEVQHVTGIKELKTNQWILLGVCFDGLKCLLENDDSNSSSSSSSSSSCFGFSKSNKSEEEFSQPPVKIISTLTFSNFSRWGCSNKYLVLWAEGDENPRYKFRTAAGDQICYLLGAYDNFRNFRSTAFSADVQMENLSTSLNSMPNSPHPTSSTNTPNTPKSPKSSTPKSPVK